MTTTYEIAQELVRERLAFLESKGSATSIANYLSDHDFGGRRNQATSCPLANYLSDTVGVSVVVGSESCVAMVLRDADEAPDHHALGEFTEQFVRLFDAGVYPDLDEDKRG